MDLTARPTVVSEVVAVAFKTVPDMVARAEATQVAGAVLTMPQVAEEEAADPTIPESTRTTPQG